MLDGAKWYPLPIMFHRQDAQQLQQQFLIFRRSFLFSNVEKAEMKSIQKWGISFIT